MNDTITPTRAAMALLDPSLAASSLVESFDINHLSKQELKRIIINDVFFDDYLEMLRGLSLVEKQALIDQALQTVVDSPRIPAEIPRFLTSMLSKDEFCRLLSAMQLCQPEDEETLWKNYRTAWRSCRMTQHLDLRSQALQHTPDSGYDTPPRLLVLGQPLQPQTIAQLPAPTVTNPPVLQITAGAQAQPTVLSNSVQIGSTNQQPASSQDHANASAMHSSPGSKAKTKDSRKVKQKTKSKSSSKIGSGASSLTKAQSILESSSTNRQRKNQKRKERRKKSQSGDDSGRASHLEGPKLEVQTQASPKIGPVREPEQVPKPDPVREPESPQQSVAIDAAVGEKQSRTKAEKRREQKKAKRTKEKEAKRKARKQAKLVSSIDSARSLRKSPSLSSPDKMKTHAKLVAPSSPASHEIRGFGALPKASEATNKSVKFYDAPSTPLDLGHHSPSRSPLSLKASRVAAQSSPRHDSSSVTIKHANPPAVKEMEDNRIAEQSSSTTQTKPSNAPLKMANPARFGPLGDPSSTSIPIPRGPNNPANKIQAQIDEMAAADTSDSNSDSDSSDDEAVKRSTRRKDDSGNVSRFSSVDLNDLLRTRPAQANVQSSRQQNVVQDDAAGSGLFNYTAQIKAALRDDCDSVGLAPDGEETPTPVESSAEDDLDIDPVAEQHNLQPPFLEDESNRNSPCRAAQPGFVEHDTRLNLPPSGETVPRPTHDASVSLSSSRNNNNHVGRIATDGDTHDDQAVLQLREESQGSYRGHKPSKAASKPSTPSRRANDDVEVIIYRSSEKQRRQLYAEPIEAEPQKSNNKKARLESQHEDNAVGDISGAGEESSPLSELAETPSPPASNEQVGSSSKDELRIEENKHEPQKRKRKSTGASSEHFDTPPKKKRAPAGISTAAFPPTSEKSFGLIQEELWSNPFRLLVAVTFLNKTTGKSAVPVYRQLMERYPTPEALAQANFADVCAMIQRLGLQNMRAKKLIRLAQDWVESPPQKSLLYRTMHYPEHGDGSTSRPNAILEVDSDKVEGFLEIGHFYGLGPYAWDSWRIFCRDVLRGVATDYNGQNAADPDFEPEWKRVLPNDKELRACLQWMWLREGYDWDPLTGEKVAADKLLLQKAAKGMIVWPVPEQTREEFLVEEAFASRASGAKGIADDGNDGGRIETGSVELDWEPRRGDHNARVDGEVMMSEKRRGKLPARDPSVEL